MRRLRIGSGIRTVFFATAGVLDFAGGTVVHINAGVAGLSPRFSSASVCISEENFAPHNPAYSVVGASLLWVGWFGFNAGSAGAANGRAAMAMTVTMIAAATAALSWMAVEWKFKGKPSVLGTITGAIAGLVVITPASGFVDPTGRLIIGLFGGAVCFLSADDGEGTFHARRQPRLLRRSWRRRHVRRGADWRFRQGLDQRRCGAGGRDRRPSVADRDAARRHRRDDCMVCGGDMDHFVVVDRTMGLRVSEEIEREGLDHHCTASGCIIKKGEIQKSSFKCQKFP